MKTIKFRVWDKKQKCFQSWEFISQLSILGIILSGKHSNYLPFQFTGYQMFDKDVYFDDLVSNNYETSKEVIRQIVEHKGCIMMKRIKGKSSMSKYILLHKYYELNYQIIGNIHQNPELLKPE